MKIFIDADGCPVVDIAVRIAKKYGVESTIICDTAHSIQRESAKMITVDKGVDSADFRLVNLVSAGDIAITQDYGLAAMCLSKKAIVLNQDGKRIPRITFRDCWSFGQFLRRYAEAVGVQKGFQSELLSRIRILKKL